MNVQMQNFRGLQTFRTFRNFRIFQAFKTSKTVQTVQTLPNAFRTCRTFKTYIATMALLIGAVGGVWCLRPFPDVILAKAVPIKGLTLAQRMNIERAASSLDGIVIAPGAQFSFNNIVGPRTERHGYLPAPSYVGVGTQSTIGGGVCLVSSIMYQLALESGLRIDKRSPHSRTVKTVAPGLDATVWFGQTDLAFTNTSSSPLRIGTVISGNIVRLELSGKRSSLPVCSIQRRQVNGPGGICVDVTRTIANNQQFVSHDIYGLGHHHQPSLRAED